MESNKSNSQPTGEYKDLNLSKIIKKKVANEHGDSFEETWEQPEKKIRQGIEYFVKIAGVVTVIFSIFSYYHEKSAELNKQRISRDTRYIPILIFNLWHLLDH